MASLVQVVIGVALVAGGAAGLNQIYERDTDSLMFRTRMRPLAAQRVTVGDALVFSRTLAAIGLGLLAATANILAAFLALLTLASYNVIYTPMKRRSQLATLVGAVPGALPPMIGWVAARGALTLEAWALFAIVFVWQIPTSWLSPGCIAPISAVRGSRCCRSSSPPAEAPRVKPCCSHSC